MAMTKVVELQMLTADERVVPQARFVLAGDRVRTVLLSEPAEFQIREILERGLPTRDRVLKEADGIAFLEALPRLFRGSRYWATEPADMDEEEALNGLKEVTGTP